MKRNKKNENLKEKNEENIVAAQEKETEADPHEPSDTRENKETEEDEYVIQEKGGDEEGEEENNTEEIESFFYIKGHEIDITSLSPYRVMAQISELLQREPKMTKVNRCLRVTCHNQTEQDRIKQMKQITGHPVEITEPYKRTKESQNITKFTNRGIIFGIEEGISNEELTKAVGIRAEIIMKRRGGNTIRTAQAILHFEGPLQEYVYIGWKRHRVSIYIPDPTRCYHCQRYEHIASKCSAKKIKCPICAGQHPYQECDIKDTHRSENKATCPNCRGPHPASYQGCPAFKQARIIKQIQTNEGISYAQAVKKQKIDQNTAEDPTTNNKPNSENKDQEQNNVIGNTRTFLSWTSKRDQEQDQNRTTKPDYIHAGTQTENKYSYTPSSESTVDNNETELDDPMHTLICEFVQDIGHVLQERGAKEASLEKLYEMVKNLVKNAKIKHSEHMLNEMNKTQKKNPNHE